MLSYSRVEPNLQVILRDINPFKIAIRGILVFTSAIDFLRVRVFIQSVI